MTTRHELLQVLFNNLSTTDLQQLVELANEACKSLNTIHRNKNFSDTTTEEHVIDASYVVSCIGTAINDVLKGRNHPYTEK